MLLGSMRLVARPRPITARSVAGALVLTMLGMCAWAAAKPGQAPAGTKTKAPAPASTKAKASGSGSYYLPDSVVLARVNDRVIRVKDYIHAFFNTSPEFRPHADSLGRRKFLETMIQQEIIAKVARDAKRPETMEDRGVMKTYSTRAYSNVLYKREVLDSVRVTEADIDSIMAQMRRRLHLQRMRFGSRQTAERIRGDLIANRISWIRAMTLHTPIPGDTTTSGDLGWRYRGEVSPTLAPVVFALPVGGISPVIIEPPVYAIYRVAEEKPVQLNAPGIFRSSIITELTQGKTLILSEKLLHRLRSEIELKYDSANVQWASNRFPAKVQGAGTAQVLIDISVPEIAPKDTGRVLGT